MGHSKLSALPAGCSAIEYTSSAYSGRLSSAISHIPSRNFMMLNELTWFEAWWGSFEISRGQRWIGQDKLNCRKTHTMGIFLKLIVIVIHKMTMIYCSLEELCLPYDQKIKKVAWCGVPAWRPFEVGRLDLCCTHGGPNLVLLNIVPLSSVDGSLPHIRPLVMIYFIEVFMLSRKKIQSSMKDDINTVMKNLQL